MTISASRTEELLVEQDGYVLTLTLNRPDTLNAISTPMLGELTEKLKEANRDSSVRVIILTGAGRGFCSGLDLKASRERRESGSDGEKPPQQLFDLYGNPITVMWNIDKPVIAAINGPAAGYGMDMTLIADIRLMADNAKLAALMVKRNVVPESGGTWLLPRLIGWGKAAEIFYRGRVLNAQESLDMGLVNAVLPQDELLATAKQWAEDIAANAPMAVQTTKRMMRMGMDETFDTAVEHLMMHFRGLTQMEDFRESLRAFGEKREPKFTGR